MRRRSLLFGVLTLVGIAVAPASAQSADELRAQIESPQPEPGPNGLGALTLDELLDSLGVPGVSIAVIRDFQVEWERGYGVADVETGQSVDAETVFQAASISKPVAAMGTMRAVQDGLFALDDDINSILTSWQLDGDGMTDRRPVTPEGLTSHTSGMGDAFGFPGYDPADPVPSVVEVLEGGELSNVGPIFVEREPGTVYEYSGGGVTLMQLALADARERAFEDVLQDDVLGPIGMTRSTFVQPLPPAWDANAARAHSGQGASMGSKWHIYPEQAAAGLWTTAGDLARFAVEVQLSLRGESNQVLDPDHARRMVTPVGVGSFGVGFSVGKRGEGWYFSHGGANWGFRSNLVAHLSKGYGFAVMTNSDSGGALMAELQRRIERVYGWDSLDQPAPRGYAPPITEPDVDLPDEALAPVLGRWVAENGEYLTLQLEDGQLGAVPNDVAQVFPLSVLSETEFAIRSAGVRVTIHRDADGTPVQLDLWVSGRTTEYRREEGGR